jgi:hypothetical protein
LDFIAESAMDMVGCKRPPVEQVLEVIQGADAVWRPGPDGVENCVEKLSAL